MNDNSIIQFPPKPEYSAPDFDGIPRELKTFSQWVVWRAEPAKPGKLKWPKVPYVPLQFNTDQNGKRTGPSPADTTKPATWRSFDEAVKAYQDSQKWPRPFNGIGFVFSGEVGSDGLTLCGIDFDKVTAQAVTLGRKLNTYTEKSASGRGFHVIARAQPFQQATCKTDALEAEAYSEKRYFAFTGLRVNGLPSEPQARPAEVVEVVAAIRHEAQSGQAKQAAIAAGLANELGDLDQSLIARLKRGQLGPVPKVFANEPFEALTGTKYTPPELAKLDSALAALHPQMASDEPFWMNHVCRPLANEARKHEIERPSEPSIKEQLWGLLDKHSKLSAPDKFKRGEYTSDDNRDRFEHVFAKGYDNQVQAGDDPILAGSIYQEAEKQGWSWIDPRLTLASKAASATVSAASGPVLKGGIYQANDATLRILSERYRLVREEGRIVPYRCDEEKGWLPSDRDSMKLELANVLIRPILDKTNNNVYKSADEWYLKHVNRPPPAQLAFKPHGNLGQNEINLWAGFGVRRDAARDKLDPILQFISEVICASDCEKYNYILWWTAWVFQHPELIPEVALVLRSDTKGVGKNTFANLLAKMFGRRHATVFKKKEHIFGQHATYEALCLVVLDEVFFVGDKQMADFLDGTITGETRSIDPKHREGRIIDNHLAIIILSNHDFVVPAGQDERRYAVADVSDIHAQDHPYFAMLKDVIDGGGAEQFLDYVLTLDLADWHPRQVLKTRELDSQRQEALPVAYRYLYSVADTEEVIVDKFSKYNLSDKPIFIPTGDLLRAIGAWAKEHNERPPSDILAGKHLTKILGPSHRAPRATNLNRKPGYDIPPADELRATLNKKLKLNNTGDVLQQVGTLGVTMNPRGIKTDDICIIS